MFPTNGECLIGISDAFFAFCLRVHVILPTCSLYSQQKRAYSALHPQAWTYVYSSMTVGTYRVQSLGFPKIVYCVLSCASSLRPPGGTNLSTPQTLLFHSHVKQALFTRSAHVLHVLSVRVACVCVCVGGGGGGD